MMRRNAFQKDVLTPRQKAIYWLIVLAWAGLTLRLFMWWFQQEVSNPLGFGLTTLVLLWVFVFPGWFFVNFARMKRPHNPTDKPYPNGTIALLVTKAPSEPFEILERTLTAMLEQNHPQRFDVWLADEQPDKETIAWCDAHGVQISTRYGVEKYHQEGFPRRTKCKEGNLAYAYDHHIYDAYDFIVQFDADHAPESGYLSHVMAAFSDPTVGFVACPSICDANASESWLVRARLWTEAALHGALQAGYSAMGMPLIIGSHYAMRVAALKSLKHPINKKKGLLGLFMSDYEYHVGGVGPELSEDHTTGLAMIANGWKGTFALDAIAHGDGASSLAASVKQEFQWSRSLVQVLLSWSKGYFAMGMSFGQKFFYLLNQLWYVFFALTMLIGNVMPLVAVMTDQPLVQLNFLDFWLYAAPATAAALMPILYLKKLKLLRPSEYDAISLETIAFSYIRWPWVLWGIINGTIGSLVGIELPIKVTKKGDDDIKPFPFSIVFPFLLMGVVNAGVSLLYEPTLAQGYLYFTVFNAVAYSLVTFITIVWHVKDNWQLGSKTQLAKTVAASAVAWVFVNVLAITAAVSEFPKAVATIFGA